MKHLPRAGWILADIVNETAGKEMKAMVEVERDKVMAALKGGIADTITKAVKEGLR